MFKRLASGFDGPTFQAKFTVSYFVAVGLMLRPEIVSRNESSRNCYCNGKIVINKDDYSNDAIFNLSK